MAPLSVAQVNTKGYMAFRGFETMDTQSAREALPPNRLAWCENIQIVGPNQLVACNSPVASIVNIPGETILSQFAAAFTPPGGVLTDYIINFCQSGSAYQTVTQTGVTTQIAPPGTFSISPDMTVWSSQRLLFADTTAGYSTWDGHTYVRQGGVSPNFFITNGGSGYATPPTVTITGGSGSGATAHAVITGGVVTSIVLDNPGTGYKAGDALTVSFSPASTTAATAIVWPFLGSNPSTLAIFAGRVWLASARTITWTGTKGFDDTSSANASGSTTLTEADLVHSVTALRAYNNFLYIFGDNSIKSIGTVTVSGSATLFNITTLSSDQGTPFPRAIASYNRLILFANKVGVYAILGASVEKVSDPMDGIFPFWDFTQPLQAAVQDLHTSLHTFLLMGRYKDPVQGITRSLILCFYKNRWFVANQGNSLTSICTAPIAGITETFSSSGNDVTQIFQGTAPVSILLQTALSDNGQPEMGKRALRASVAFNTNTFTTMTLTSDSENGSVAFPFQAGRPVGFVNNLNQPVTFFNNVGQTVNFFGLGFQYQRSKAAASGVYLGLSLSGSVAGGSGGVTSAAQGFVVNELVLEYQDAAALASNTAA